MRVSLTTLLAAAGASLCCIGPALAFVMGASTLTVFSWLDPLRPALSVAAVSLLGLSFWRSYRPGRAVTCCEPDERVRLRRQRRTVWWLSPVVASLLAFPYLQPYLYGQDEDHQAALEQRGIETSWQVAGMTCAGCAAGLEGALAAHDGMLTCRVIFSESRMECTHDPARFPVEGIPGLVGQLGFQARQLKQAVGQEPSAHVIPTHEWIENV